MSRPEHQAPPEIYYNETEAQKYSQNTRIMQIQSEMADRCIEILQPESQKDILMIDIGSGSGISGQSLTEKGLFWIGIDISPYMINKFLEREQNKFFDSNQNQSKAIGDTILADMGQGLPFRPGVFDGGISVSALQ